MKTIPGGPTEPGKRKSGSKTGQIYFAHLTHYYSTINYTKAGKIKILLCLFALRPIPHTYHYSPSFLVWGTHQMEQCLGHNGPPAQVPADNDYWDGYVNEHVGAKFLGFTVPFLQNLRHRGGGPPYSKINKSVRYTRRRLKTWADEQLLTSTSDTTEQAAA